MKQQEQFSKSEMQRINQAIRLTEGQPCPKFEKIKPMIPEIVAHLKVIGWIEKEAE